VGLHDNAGPLLIRAGLITREQLRVALDAMRQSGGTLPEQLALRHVVDEERLCAFFSERLVVPRVGMPELAAISPSVIATLPADMAGEFRVIPIQIDSEKNVHLAMMDPSDTHAIDEVAFFAGMTVMRFVAPPTAIAWALHRYYGLHTPLAAEAAVPVAVAAGGGSRSSPTTSLGAPPSKKKLPAAEIVDPVYDVDTPLPAPIPFDTTGRVILLEPNIGNAPHAAPRSSAPETDEALAKATHELAAVADRDALASCLTQFLRKLCRRAAFFQVRRGELVGWMGSGIGVHQDALREAILPLDRPSTFRDIVRTRLPFRGPVTDVPSRDFLIEGLGWAPSDMLAVPVSQGDRVIGVLYGDERIHPLPDEVLAHVVRAAEQALARLR
jgi:hypothetical protein